MSPSSGALFVFDLWLNDVWKSRHRFWQRLGLDGARVFGSHPSFLGKVPGAGVGRGHSPTSSRGERKPRSSTG